jgi:hypothetical protein
MGEEVAMLSHAGQRIYLHSCTLASAHHVFGCRLTKSILLFVASLLASDDLYAKTYYVDCDAGKNLNNGLNEANAWRTVSKVSDFKFANGDEILFKRGCKWENASLKIKQSLNFGAYGNSPEPPELIGARRAYPWLRLKSSEIFSTQAAIEAVPSASTDVFVVYDAKHKDFYEKVSSLDLVNSAGRFFYDLAKRTLYIYPLQGASLNQNLYISSQPNLLEFQTANVESVVVNGLKLSLANHSAIDFYHAGRAVTNGALKVENCIFFGNAYSAIGISGTNSFETVDILNNTITANGWEGIYIGYLNEGKEGEVIKKLLRIAGNKIGGNGFGWRSEGPGSAANGDGIDLKPGIVSAIIENNTIDDLKGIYGIGVHTSDVIIQDNIIRNVRMPGATAKSNMAGIYLSGVDIQGRKMIIRRNTIDLEQANGLVIRGDWEHPPRVEVHQNEISVGGAYFPFAFTAGNIKNTEIRHNKTQGGKAGVLVYDPCCRPSDVNIHDNEFRKVKKPVVANQSTLSPGMGFNTNTFSCHATSADDSDIYGDGVWSPNADFIAANALTSCD